VPKKRQQKPLHFLIRQEKYCVSPDNTHYKMTKNRARDAAYGRFARKMRRFPPKLDESAKMASTHVSLPKLNPNATAFVPDDPMQSDSIIPQIANLPTLDGSEVVGFVMPSEDVEVILAMRKALPNGQRIKYNMKDLLGMKPLNPNAREFTPFWLQGIHTERDFAMFQAQGMLPQFTCGSGNMVEDKTCFRAQKAS